MLALKYLLITGGLGMIFAAVCILTYDLYREMLYRRALETPGGAVGAAPVVVRWRTSLALAMLAWGPLLVAFSIVVVPSGMAGVRVSEMSGTVPGTLYPGAHVVMPLVETWRCSTRAIRFLPPACRRMERARRRTSPRRHSFWMCRRRKD
jgi:hypothetical protein